jgi:2,5-diamino-6-(ribosylamino)-4(3H)-pyrimidinone 5'-phosphate reductase
MTEKTYNTLFLLQSIDGKISTGAGDLMDVDQDFPKIHGVKEGLHQYYELELKTDLCSLNSGKVQAKVGVNTRNLDSVVTLPMDFVVIDNQPHLDAHGCEYFAKKSNRFIVVTTNISHPGYTLQKKYSNIIMLYYPDTVDFTDVFKRLRTEFAIPRVTIQTGGTLNAEFLRLGLIDELAIVVAPCLIGGKHTPSLIDGQSLVQENDLQHIKAFELKEAKVLKDSYLLLRYVTH